MPKRAGAALATESHSRNLLEKHWQVIDLEVPADSSGRAKPLDDLDLEAVPVRGLAAELIGRGESSGQSKGQGMHIGVDQAAHELGEDGPRVALVGQRRLGSLDEHVETIRAKSSQQLLLAVEPAIYGADPNTRPLRYPRDRRGRVLDEHLPGRLQDPLVVKRSLRTAPAQRRTFIHLLSISKHPRITAGVRSVAPLCSIGTDCSVPSL